MRSKLFLLITFFLFYFQSYSQCPVAFPVDLSASSSAVYSQSNPTIGPLLTNCCPSFSSDGNRCIKFSITLNPGSMGVRFEMNPAPSSGIYRIGCGSTAINVGSFVCLSGAGPHILTFCNPADITSLFKIVSVPRPTAGPNISISQGCSKVINATGFDPGTIIWKSVPNNPIYNGYLSCTNCLNPTIIPGSSPPAYVDYQICGSPSTNGCGPLCDTVRVFFTPPLSVTISPANPIICNGQTPNSTTIAAVGLGGSGSYTYLWNNINSSQNITVPYGLYTVVLSDGTGCNATASVQVQKYTVPVSANAGPDQTVCYQFPTATLNGSVAGAGGGIWSGGGGVFSPNTASLTATYTPSSLELSVGFADLTLTTTGNGTCAAATDVVRINYAGFTGTALASVSVSLNCYGGSTGSVTVSVVGGVPPYTYSWNTSPAQTASTASGLGFGNYTVTITNGIGCTTTSSATIIQPPPIALASTINNVTCSGGSNGAISIAASGGTIPYTYLWQPGNQTTASIINQIAGTYTVNVTDSKGCLKSSTYTITQPNLITIALTPTPVSCFNGIDGIANSTVSGGTSPYTYNWSSGATSPNASGLSAGTYTLNVTDNLGCLVSNTVNVTQPATAASTISIVNETCSYQNNGTATVLSTGGSAPYTYLWQPGAQTTGSISNLSSGTYTLTSVDSRGCTITSFATITEPAPLVINFISQVNVSCFGGTNGIVTASPAGGTPNYTYLWAPGGATTASRNSLQAGTYTVTVTDYKGCSATNSVTITAPTAPLTVSPTIADVTCNGVSNGSIALAPSGGTAPYTYFWQPGNQTNPQITGLAAGTYTVTVKDSKACPISSNYTVMQPAPTLISFTPTHVSCVNGNDGAVSAILSGGNSPFTYSWNNGATTAQISNLTSQTYTLTVSDFKGCNTTNTVAVNQPVSIALNPLITHIVCSGGSSGAISLSPTGGNTPYTYLWSSGATTAQITNLSIGTYSVTVTDSKGCQTISNYTITQLTLSVTLTPSPVTCFGGNNGSISALPSGGTPNFTYSWLPGSASTNAISNLTAGTYTLSVTDSKGCVASSSVTLTQPNAVSASTSSTNETCNYLNNGTATAIPSGGTSPYTYLWQPALQTTGTVSNLQAGTYTLTVTDSNECSATATAIITQPIALAIGITGQTNVSTCFGDNDGAITASASGGTPTYTYSWMPGSGTTNAISDLTAGTYTLTLSDLNGCSITKPVVITQPSAVSVSTTKTNETCSSMNNGTATATAVGGSSPYTYLWSNGATTALITNLSSQTYTVTVTDSKGCTSNALAVISETTLLVANFTGQINVSCFGGNNGIVSATPAGGTPNYTYLWAPGGTTSATKNNAPAGTYTVTVTDSKGCTATNSVVITEPPVLLANTVNTNETCGHLNNGTATANPIGGNPAYTYLWKPGLQTTATLSNLPAATYTLIVTDSRGCIATSNSIITEPSVLAINFTGQINVSTCFGDNNGSVTVTPSGGYPGYTYSWAPGAATTATINNLTAGTYTLTLLDNVGCSVIKPVVITEPTLLSAIVSNTNESCSNLNNGTATVVATGGTPGSGYTYLWQPGGQTSSSISGLSANTYTITATDSKGCTSTTQAIVAEPVPLSVNFSGQTNATCFGGNNGVVASVPAGGTPNYTYLWSPGGATTANRNNLAAGTHTVTITDSKGCNSTNSVLITQPVILSASTTTTIETCSYSNNGTATVIPAGGSPGYTYSWQPGFQTTVTKTGLSSGTYTVTVKDSKGCTVTAPAIVTEPPVLAINFTSQINVSCKGGNNGSVTASPTGGTSGYTYLWSPGGATTANRTNLSAGTYSVTVTDTKGCIVTKPVIITQPTLLITSTSKTNETCNNLNNGKATATCSGGTASFTYLWQPGAFTTSTITNLSAGTYSVTATDSKGCTATSTAIITEPATLTVSFSAQTNVSCFGGSNGTVAASGAGGTLNYSYSWAPGGATTNSVSNFTAGTKTVTITDSKGCTATNSVVLTQPTALTVSASTITPTCYQKADGSITATGAGGIGPYTYAWVTPTPASLTGATISNTRAGTYFVTIMDAKGCTTNNSFTIAEPPPLILTITTVNSGCNLANGSASVSVTNGTPSYSYLWSTGSITNTAINLAADSYTVKVTDANGCISIQGANVNDDSAATLSISVTQPSCYGYADGTATVSAVGGYGTLSYLWSPYGGTGATATGLSIDTFTVKVITLPNGCKSSSSVVLTQPTPVLLTTSSNRVSCFGGSNGSATSSTLGGTPGYTYQWLPGGTTTSGIINRIAGTYTLNVTDSKGCVQTKTAVITQPSLPVSVSISSFTNVSCFGGTDGSASASSATGGNGGAFQYNWMPGNINGQNTSTLSAATYTVTAKDYKGCTGTAITTITEPTLLTQSFSNQTNVSCYDGNNGSVASNASGGTPGYTYLWQPGGATTTSISNLIAGADTVFIVDLKGCILKDYVTITQPTELLASTSITNTTCNYYTNGKAKAIHTGGTPPYSYLWLPGGFTTDSISNLSIGTYSLTVTDSFGCSANATAVITEPAQLGITFSDQIDVSCFGGSDGSVSATASGGTLNYNYSWMPGSMTTSSLSNLTIGTFTLTVTDTNNCLTQSSVTITQPLVGLTSTISNTPVSCFGGSDGSISAIASGGTAQYNYSYMPGNLNGENPSNLASGTYTLTVTDSKGCAFIDSTTITQATPVMLSMDSINSNCSFANGQASVSVSGGTGSYLYQWTPSGGTNSTATALLSGSYTVSVSDSNACIATKEVTVNDNPIPVAAIYSTTNVSCTGGTNGTASATVSGTSGPFTYSWLPIGGTDSIGTGLSIGSYTLTVTDTNLCQSLPVTSPEITEPNPIYISVTTSPLSCFGGSDGNASAIAAGGTPGYTYQWLPSGTTGTSITNLSANTYNILVTDTNSCVQTTAFTIIGPSTYVSDSLSYTPVSCYGGGDGSVTASAFGGTAPYDYNWMPGNYNAQTLFNLTVGTYTVTIFDANGCSMMDSITITQSTPLILTSSGINAKCDLPNGQASVSVTGGIAPYSYQWSNAGETTATITDLLPGSYTVSVTDSNACPASTIVTVIPNPSPIATVIATTNVSCNGGSDGTATVSVSGSAAGPFTYSWIPSSNTGSIATGLSAGTYTVTVTDANLCVSLPEISPEITEPSPVYIAIIKTPVSCFGSNTGSAIATPSGGTPGYTYLWSPGGTTGTSLTNLSANSYTIQVTDTNSCVKTTPFAILGPTVALSVSISLAPVSCFGGADGYVSGSASGGTAPYNYFWMPGSLVGKNQSNLTIGTYTVTIVDSKGCSLVDSILVTQPNLMVLNPSSTNSYCSDANGQASVSASGGTGSYLYEWSPSGGTNDTAKALISGVYSVLVTDSNLCASSASVTVNDNPSPIATVFSTTNVSCNGGADGTASAIASGSSGPFTYSWLPSGGTDSIATGLLPGTYTVTVTDTNLCQSLPAISPVITEPTPISITVSTSTMSCFGGNNETASANATGGTPGYTYQWLPSGTLGTTISNLSANTYTIQVTDTKSCIQTELFTIAEPSLLTASISSTVNVSCFGGNNGAATVIASGGTPVYGYSWSPTGGNGPTGTVLASGTYTVTITDLNGCIIIDSAIITQPSQALSATSTVSTITCFGLTNGTANIVPVGGTPGFSYQWNPSVSTSDTASGLSVGNYNIMVTDTNSCQTNLSLSISQPAILSGSLASVNPSCNLPNGSITPQISGGTYPYTYLWSPGTSTNYGINGLAQGNYSVQISDAFNCSLSLSASLTDIPVPLLSISSIDDVSCFGGDDGSSTITISQGVPPYAINWSPSGGNNLTATSLTVGTYSVTIIDASGCEISDSAVVTEPTPIDLSALTVSDVLCNGGNSGSISIVPTGGTGPLYTYSWAPSSSSSPTASNLTIGTYTLNVMDQNNCLSAISVNITQPTPFSSIIDSVQNPICFNGYGSATSIASGGVLPYTYFWSPSSDSVSKANNLKADSYTITVTDANGCISTNTLLLTQPTQVITSTGQNDTVCLGQTGVISATAIGGTGNYYYGWQPSGAITAGTLPITPTSDVTYTVVAYDQNGCAGTQATTDVIVYTLDTFSVHAYATSPICPGQSSVVYVETLGTTGTLTYQWNNNLGTGPGVYLVAPPLPTTYIVTVSNACTSITDSVNILFNPPPAISLASDTSALCVPGTIQFFDNSVTGNPNDPITTWNWSFGDGTSSTMEDPPHSYTVPSDYQVTLTVTTSGGCTNSTTTPLIINGHPFPVAAFSLSSTDLDLPYDELLCNNQSIGASTYNWSFGDGETSTLINPQYLYSTIGIYQVQLIAMTEYGCMDTANSEVTTNAEVKFPNAFTPNPDGTSGGFFDINSLDNNIFFPYTSGVVEYKLEVYNRWGEIIFETQDAKQGWDGYYKNQLCPQDVYIWRAFIKLNNGKIFNKNGNLTLLR
jgi:gliding motility-associated-like protein